MAKLVSESERDLLIRLDQKVSDGFEAINRKLDEITRRADGHEDRLRDLEIWRSEMTGGGRGLSLGWKIAAGLGAFLGGGATFLGVQSIEQSRPIAKAEQISAIVRPL